MLANTLPGVRTEGYVNEGLTLELAALTLWASYNGVSPTTRPVDSLNRAFGIVSNQTFPRVPGGRPCIEIAHINDGSSRGRFSIGIEGMTSLRQHLFITSTNSAALHFPETDGYVYGPALTYAAAILTIVQTSSIITGEINGAWNTEICIGGHSLGGQIAELLALRMQAIYPFLRLKYCKFNSPCTGNAPHYAGRSLRVSKRNIRTERDPAHVFPFTDIALGGSFWNSLTTPFARYCTDPSCETILPSGEGMPGYNGSARLSVSAASTGLGYPFNSGNQWSHHSMRAMRRMLMRRVGPRPDLNKYRFYYLEYPDEWSEQNTTTVDVGEDVYNYNLDGVAPPAVTCPDTLIAAYEGRPITVVAYEGDTGDGGGGGGDDFGGEVTPRSNGQFTLPAPEHIAFRRRRRVGVR